MSVKDRGLNRVFSPRLRQLYKNYGNNRHNNYSRTVTSPPIVSIQPVSQIQLTLTGDLSHPSHSDITSSYPLNNSCSSCPSNDKSSATFQRSNSGPLTSRFVFFLLYLAIILENSLC